MQSQNPFRIPSLESRLAVRVRKIIFEGAKLKESSYRLSVDGVLVTFVVSISGVKGVIVCCGA